ncbi:MAG: single-stranded-DNA-specific exonuclease RecJ [Lachnospiraceae bacterium]|nr:single-stranded-DNA-specific exonuclease RecJ [Lachnospiraceae bacterium]
MKEKWMVYAKKADFDGISKRFGIDKVTARILRNRDVYSDEDIRMYLEGDMSSCHSPHLMKDADKAAHIIKEKIEAGARIRIVGDYDVDGVCSTFILYKGLKALGAHVDYDIPDRIRDGYGINIRIIEDAKKSGVDTIITCDNGISAYSQIAYAKALGLTVIITDHHDVPFDDNGEVLPPADAVVNPKQRACSYPFDGLCGAVVAYKLIEILYELFATVNVHKNMLTEAAGLATVADVMVLKDENRVIVKEALKLMKESEIPGIRCLKELNNLYGKEIGAYHLGFIIGPSLNAGGRLDTAKKALDLLLAPNEAAAMPLAAELKQLNDTRKELTQRGIEEAVRQIEDSGIKNDKVFVVYLRNCHESIAGIIAGRIRELYNHPVFVLTDGEELVKGSGRSIEGYHMYEGLSEVKELLEAFGGHPMAAGLSLKQENVETFRAALNNNAQLDEEAFTRKIWIDVPMPFSYVTEQLVEELSGLEPFGNGNEKPLFAQKGLKIRRAGLIGKNKNVAKLILSDAAGASVSAVIFSGAQELMDELNRKFGENFEGKEISVVYYPTINEYNGNRTVQIVIQNYMIS